MAKIWITILAAFLLASVAGAQQTPALKTDEEIQSYALGVDYAKGFQKLGFVNIDLVIQGMRDVQEGKPLLLDDSAIKSALIGYRGNLAAKMRGERMVATLGKDKERDEFLAANKLKPEVVSTHSGLQYKVLKQGDGKIPTKTDTVEVNYRGTLVNGTEFENTFASGKPALINISDLTVMAGLREVLQLMPVGSRWAVFIPWKLGYLQQGKPPLIPPNATLIYELELLAIK